MREILFRGKRVDNNEWVFGSFIHNSIDAHCIIDYDAEQFEVIPETIGQFTGLLDKNGKKIFEGDIVTITEIETEVQEVFFFKGYFAAKNVREEIKTNIDTSYDVFTEFLFHSVEINGNIHE